MTVTWLDWVMLALLLLSVLLGLQRGPVRTLVESAFVLASYLGAAVLFRQAAETFFGTTFPWPDWAATVAFAVLFLIFLVVGNFLTAWIAGRRAATGVAILLGGLVGVVKAAVLGVVLVTFLLSAPFAPQVRQDVDRSASGPYLVGWQLAVHRAVSPLLPVRLPALGPGGEKF
ncbi:hypothetical protein HRbin32_00362 [bacterium HR32]|jgi:uncharacterized membrane protein required for colicin V production|nr:hypothetical protein HRbin32_00362 [bacterium HR32]